MQYDATTGQYYDHARYYNAASIVLRADILGFVAGDTNLYRFVDNTPTEFTDPTGELQQPTGTQYPVWYGGPIAPTGFVNNSPVSTEYEVQYNGNFSVGISKPFNFNVTFSKGINVHQMVPPGHEVVLIPAAMLVRYEPYKLVPFGRTHWRPVFVTRVFVQTRPSPYSSPPQQPGEPQQPGKTRGRSPAEYLPRVFSARQP